MQPPQAAGPKEITVTSSMRDEVDCLVQRRWKRPVRCVLSFDMCRQLVSLERKAHATTFGVISSKPSYDTDADESDSATSSADESERLLVNAHYIWSKGRRVRLIGTLQRQHEAKIQPILTALDQAKQKRLASRSRPKATYTRPLSAEELELNFSGQPRRMQYALEQMPPYYALFRWRGRETCLVVDRVNFVIGVLGNPSASTEWTELMEQTTQLLEQAASKFSIGDLTFVDIGLAYMEWERTGVQRPAELIESDMDASAEVVEFVASHVNIRALSQNANTLLNEVLPGVATCANAHGAAIFALEPTLNRIVPHGAWTNMCIDLGGQTDALPKQHIHILGWAWIAITAFGNFNPDLGGHLILWDVGRVIRFPPGTTILLPALIRYSIAKIQPGETRYSIIQYTPTTPKWQSWPSVSDLLPKYL
ncbi:hypothetical protein C8R43DRAFT_942198 [Mycena crocata]|nr:hypothetical protein C8R43DRAFT_942198 [Mycena crocata]